MTTNVEYLVFAGLAIGALVRLLKTEKMARMLADLGLPPVPRRALPWISGALGVVLGTIDAMVKGVAWDAALRGAVLGLLSGALATWGHQAVIESGRRGVELGAPVVQPVREQDDGPVSGGP